MTRGMHMAKTKEDLIENTDGLSKILETLIKAGKDKGFITYEDVAEAYEEQEDIDTDDIDQVYERLEKAQIQII